MPDYLQFLRECCRDEAAFERLKEILASAFKDEKFCQQIGCLEPTQPENNRSLPNLKCQPPKQSFSESESSKAIARIGGYEEEIIGDSSIEINARVNPLLRVKMQQLLQEKGGVRDVECQFYNKSGEVLVGLLSAEVTNFSSQQYELTVKTNITDRQRAKVQVSPLESVCTSPQADSKGFCKTPLLGEMALRIRKSLNLEQILNTTVEEVRQFLQADRVFIGCIDEEGLGEILAESVTATWLPMKGWKLNESYVREIKSFYELETVRAIADTSKVEKTAFLNEYYTKYQVRSGLGVPIVVGEKFFGVLVANQCSGPRQWQQFEIDLLSKLATQVSIAIQQAQLYKQVQTLNSNLERQVKERTAQLAQRNRELQESNRIKDVLLHTVSHDIRTSVMGTLMILKNWLNRAEETISIPRQLLEKMVTGSDRQLNMINALLETHASEEQGAIVHRELVQFNNSIESIIKDLDPLLAENQAILTNLIPADLPLVMADPTQMQRVFETLFTYTLKRNPPGLRLTLQATVERGMLRCTLQDNGNGMSQVECDRLFDLYVRDPQAKCSTGIGLKLYFCRQIIKAHGGEIGAISKLKQGSTFWFTLPIAN